MRKTAFFKLTFPLITNAPCKTLGLLASGGSNPTKKIKHFKTESWVGMQKNLDFKITVRTNFGYQYKVPVYRNGTCTCF